MINSITGQTLDKAIADVGHWTQDTSHASDMKCYIALSRVWAAHDLLLTNVLPPTIFQVVLILGQRSCSPFYKA
eukprot:2045295-Karenia_brevis.AAC.1